MLRNPLSGLGIAIDLENRISDINIIYEHRPTRAAMTRRAVSLVEVPLIMKVKGKKKLKDVRMVRTSRSDL
jgi:hypothetical protein